MSEFHLVAGAGANATSIKGAPGTITGYEIFNNAWYTIFVKFHDTAQVPTPGVGVARTIGVQGGESVDTSDFIGFANGIGITIVKGIADSDATPIAANDCVVNLSYI